MRKKAIAIGAAVVAAAGISGAAIANAGGGEDEGHVSGPTADRASAAALKATGGGTVNEVEAENEQGATWGVEVTKDDGATVDVFLDENYKVIGIEGDSENADSGDSED
jgi:uncharacterized membrane protein YkoI